MRAWFEFCLPFFGLVGTTTVASVSFPTLAWKQSSIEVCIGDLGQIDATTWSENRESHAVKNEATRALGPNPSNLITSFEMRRNIHHWVSQQLSVAKLGIDFTGFKICDLGNHPVDLVVFVYSGNLGIGSSSRLGAGYRSHSPHSAPTAGLIPAVVLDFGILEQFPWNLERHRQYTVLHEFAHVLGLEHEHDRRESLQDQYCIESQTDLNRIRRPLSPKAKVSRKYDPQSITHYCWINWVQNPRSQLSSSWIPHWSDQDILALRRIYPLGRRNHMASP